MNRLICVMMSCFLAIVGAKATKGDIEAGFKQTKVNLSVVPGIDSEKLLKIQIFCLSRNFFLEIFP